jgi:hypothetical protein
VWRGKSEKGIFWVLPPFLALGLALASGSKCCCSHSPPQDFGVYRVQHKKERKNLPRFFQKKGPRRFVSFGETAKSNAVDRPS